MDTQLVKRTSNPDAARFTTETASAETTARTLNASTSEVAVLHVRHPQPPELEDFRVDVTQAQRTSHAASASVGNNITEPSAGKPPFNVVTNIFVAPPRSSATQSLNVSLKALIILTSITVSLYFIWGTVGELNRLLLFIERPFAFIYTSIAGVGCTFLNFRCAPTSSVAYRNPAPSSTAPQDFSSKTAYLTAQLEAEATHADSLTALILTFANGTAIRLLHYRHEDIDSVARDIRLTDLPNKLELYNAVQNVGKGVVNLSERLIELNSFGSRALEFFVREFVVLEGDLQEALSSPGTREYQVLGERVNKFIERFSQRIDAYIVVVNDAHSSVVDTREAIQDLVNHIIDNEVNLGRRIESRGRLYQALLHSLTIEGQHERKNMDVLSISRSRMVEIQGNLNSARTLLFTMRTSANGLRVRFPSGVSPLNNSRLGGYSRGVQIGSASTASRNHP
ncbi:hypothetical protein C8R46DRAFT_1045350 [Mycena filopes]|nr:hypothetical protein C8R46DRAFT_1045350 [Mycena filopes]